MFSPSSVDVMKVEEQLEISVSEPQKIGEGMSAYVVYKVTTKTNLPYFKKNLFSVSRRFSDFLGLHEKLVQRNLNLGIIVPPAPEKNVVEMTKVKVPIVESLLSDDFIEKRRAALERYINRTASHPVLRADSDLHNFLQNETDLPKATNTFTLSGAGVVRFFSRIEETVNKMTFKMKDTDPWFEEKQRHFEKLDEEMRKMHKFAEAAIDHRNGILTLTALFAKSAATMSLREEDAVLSNVFSQLATVEEKIEPLERQQANFDFYLLSELLNDYIDIVSVIKEVFHRRVKIYQALMQTQKILNEKRKQREQIELAGQSEPPIYALVFLRFAPVSRKDVIEWEEKVKRGEEEFTNISKTIRNEIERFEQTAVHDFETKMVKYVELLLKTHCQMYKHWEEFLPEAKALS